ncbi:MAG TPA: nucleotidyltransferase family protein [Gemmatimonadaceae bacterium]|nr:nucleotidyltransferase family protein [Gemmatimonadaceae bacterium]
MTAEYEERLERVIITPEITIADALRRLERAGTGALVVCRDRRTLCGLLTDGDIRRAILSGVTFDRPCLSIAKLDPVTAPPGISQAEALHLMNHARAFVIDQLPLVTDDGEVVGLLLRSDLAVPEHAELSAVIMAGGFGKRLLPLTEHVPKPMLPVGGRPLLERTIERLRDAGIRRVAITTHYLADHIASHFGDGCAHGVELDYLTEQFPLGTAGALRLLRTVDEPLLVMNGDILTSVRFPAMLAFHRRHEAMLTVGLRKCDLEIPYGVVDCEEAAIIAVREKPRMSFLVNAGVYVVESAAQRFIPAGRRFDMTDLIAQLLADGQRVVGFPIVEYWLDIGQHTDYEQAQADITLARFD